MLKSWDFDHTSTTLQPRGLPSVINIEGQSQSCVSMFQLDVVMFINAFSNLDNIFIKRWITPLSNVEKTFIKR